MLSGLLVSAFDGALSAQGISVGPVRISMPAERPSTTVEVRSGDFLSATLVQVTAFVWTEDEGERVLVPTRELTVTPEVFRLDPGAVRSVVLEATTGSDLAASASRYYRIRVEEVPDESDPSAEQGFTLRRAFDLPVFVERSGTRPSLVATAEFDAPTGGARLRVTNEGEAYALASVARLMVGESAVASASGQYYLLPGTSREIVIESPEGGSTPALESYPTVRFILEDGLGLVLTEGAVERASATAAGGSS